MMICLVVIVSTLVVLVSWITKRSKSNITIFEIVLAVLLALFIGVAIGWEYAGYLNYERYVWRFSQYSGYIRGLAERQQIGELTNTVILFDSRFNARQDPRDLEDVIFQIFKLGKYFDDTNAVISTQPTNNAPPRQ